MQENGGRGSSAGRSETWRLAAFTMRRTIIRDLEKLVGTSGVLSSTEDLLLYEYDGCVEEARPDAIVFPRGKQDVVEIVKLANRYDVSILGRGAGTGLSGALARQGGI